MGICGVEGKQGLSSPFSESKCLWTVKVLSITPFNFGVERKNEETCMNNLAEALAIIGKFLNEPD